MPELHGKWQGTTEKTENSQESGDRKTRIQRAKQELPQGWEAATSAVPPGCQRGFSLSPSPPDCPVQN